MAGFDIQEVENFILSDRQKRKKSIRDEIRKENGRAIVKLHNTDIAEIDVLKRKIKMRSGGWRTPTTKQRLNQLLGSNRIVQRKGQWLFDNKPFQEDMEINF